MIFFECCVDFLDAMDFGAQRQKMSDLLWSTVLISKFGDDVPFQVVQEIVEYVDPTEDWGSIRPVIGENPTCKCTCICGYEKYKQKREEMIQEASAIKKKKARNRALADIDYQLVDGKVISEVMVGKIMNTLDFQARGVDPKNTMIQYSTKMDPLQTKCICLCYCGSIPLDATKLRESGKAKPRYLDTITIQQAHSQNLTLFFQSVSSKYPIEKYPLLRKPSDYLQKSNLQNWIFAKQILKDMLVWQNYPIPHSITQIRRDRCTDDDHYARMKLQALKIFKQICCVCGDCPYRNNRDLPMKIIQKGLEYTILRDEIFAQLIKQTRSNPSSKSCLHAWKLLYLCLSAFTPSHEMSLVVLSHIASYARGRGIGTFSTIRDAARHCYFAWKSTMQGNIQRVTIKDTWKLFSKKESLLKFEIIALDGSRVMIHIPNHYTVGQILYIVCQYFGINRKADSIYWMIKGLCQNDEINAKLHFTSPHVNALLMTSRWAQAKEEWDNSIDEMKHSDNKSEDEIEEEAAKQKLQVKFVIYKRIWTLEDCKMTAYDNPAYRRMIYAQVSRDFYEGLLKPTLSETITLVAIRIAIHTKGRNLTMDETSWYFLSKFVPKWAKRQYKKRCSPKDWRDQIMASLKQFVYSKLEYKRQNELKQLKASSRHWTVKQTIQKVQNDDAQFVKKLLNDPNKSYVLYVHSILLYPLFQSTLHVLFVTIE